MVHGDTVPSCTMLAVACQPLSRLPDLPLEKVPLPSPFNSKVRKCTASPTPRSHLLADHNETNEDASVSRQKRLGVQRTGRTKRHVGPRNAVIELRVEAALRVSNWPMKSI